MDTNVDMRLAVLRRQKNANIWEIDFHNKVDKEHAFLSILGVIINMLGGKLGRYYDKLFVGKHNSDYVL